MSPKTKNLLVRTASGAVYVALMVAGTFCPPLMVVLMCVVSLLAINEFCNLCAGPKDYLSRFLMMVMAIAIFVIIMVSARPLSGFTDTTGAFFSVLVAFPSLLIAYVLIMATSELFRKRPCPIEQIGKGIFGIIWIVLPLSMMAALTFSFPQLILAFLILIWGNDTFAYLGGSTYGKHKMFERISPKKTWEGTLTGAVLTIILALVLFNIPYFSYMLSVGHMILFAIIIVLFGTVGDLLESLFKRSIGVKDSGNIMPGHGGILDRFDSILFAAIPICLFIFALYLEGF